MKKLLASTFAAALLLASPGANAQTQCVTNAKAGGTVNAITIPLLPCGMTTNILILTALGANTSTNVTLQMAGFPALPVLRNDRTALQVGDIPGANAVIMLTATGSSWLVLQGNAGNPLPIPIPVADGGTGVGTLASHGLVYGNGTSAVGVTAAGGTGEVLIGTTGAAPSWLATGTTGQVLSANTGLAPSWSSVASLGVSSLSFGSTGLTPSSPTTGAIAVAGTLALANGGTGGTTVANFWTNFGQSSTSAIISPTGAGVVTINPASAGTVDNVAVGQSTPLAVKSTTLVATGAVTLSPANLNVVASPTGSGLVTINPATAGSMNNMVVGNSTPLAGSFSTLTAGVVGGTTGTLSLNGSTSGTVAVKVQAAPSNYNFNLPSTAGTSGTPLLSGGGGAAPMTYGTLSGNTSAFATKSGSWTTGNCVSVDASGNLVDNGTPCGTGGAGTVTSSTAGQVAYYPASAAVVAGNSGLTMSGTSLQIGVANTSLGQLKLTGSTSGTITITGQAAAGSWEFDLPITAGTSGQFLTSAGGAGAPMTWSTPSSWPPAPTGISGDTTATANLLYCINTTSAVVTLTLPASPSNGDKVGYIDCNSKFATHNLTVARNGNTIMGLSQNMTVNLNNQGGTLIYVSANTDWRFLQ